MKGRHGVKMCPHPGGASGLGDAPYRLTIPDYILIRLTVATSLEHLSLCYHFFLSAIDLPLHSLHELTFVVVVSWASVYYMYAHFDIVARDGNLQGYTYKYIS
ncbi:hypothetical protein L6452_25997 [Arctium lappa]|uniref:Uncharacterized protein n=1 Tax=Arctium lappa TaxID=4217 RepID=A0ACB9AC81_ARCLA|nr:hypothetical protein L6452_25997 [Arctium lappa]